ncbi:hypothetical protein V7128_05610 [Neobacillus vireti]|uniref:hypothetical protein n=1 Tax=Neobacillus vireti TaxID=220686 RepID=UPI002FFE8803
MLNEQLENIRVKELLDYLNVLSQVQGSGHYVNEEIKEAVKEIRLELGLEKRKQDQLKDSRKMLFDVKIKEREGKAPTFTQRTLFEAVFSSPEKVIVVPYLRGSGATTAALTLAQMFGHVTYLGDRIITDQVKHKRVLPAQFVNRSGLTGTLIVDFVVRTFDTESHFGSLIEIGRVEKLIILKGVE